MRTGLFLAVGVLEVLAVAAAWSEEPGSTDPAPWQVLRVSRSDNAQPDAKEKGPALSQWKKNRGQPLYQEVTVTQKSNYRVQGFDMGSSVQYRVLSSFAVQKAGPDGTLVVQQKVEAAELLQADPLVRTIFGDLLQKLVGTTFEITLNPQMEIVSFKGAQQPIRTAAGGNPLDGQSLLLASLVDSDGWKELAQLSFFQPAESLYPGQEWNRELTHSWGPLGRWKGRVGYTCLGEQQRLQRIAYALELDYLPPDGKGPGLPFRIANPSFKHQEAGGTIYFDSERGRVSRAEERFHVKGSMAVELLGQSVPLELEEDQSFHIRVFGQPPSRN